MSDGNKFDVNNLSFQRQQRRLPLDEMGNILLDAMQGTLICLDQHHIIVDASQTVKRYFGFEQVEIIGLSILLLVEDTERDFFLKFLNSSQKISDVCCVRMMLNHIGEYRQVKVHRKKKSNPETVDVHSTTVRSMGATVQTVLVLTLEETSFIDITLHDINKQEFYTKMNLFGEITFEDHRAALITGYLPNELCQHSIFDFVYHEDRLVKLHALWKCVTTGASKLQWRLTARDASLVFLQTEYKLIMDAATHQEIIVARNEVLSQVQRSQFDELQAAWRHQCTADIKGNNLSFRTISSSDTDNLFTAPGECRISVPTLNMCFTANKLQPLNLVGNIFEGTKLTRPLTIQDYIQILIDKQKVVDHELLIIINNIESLTARYRRTNESEKQSNSSSETTNSGKEQSELSGARRTDSDSIVRGILKSSAQYNQSTATDNTHETFNQFVNGNLDNPILQNPPSLPLNLQSQNNSSAIDFTAQPVKLNQSVINSETHRKHLDFLKKYSAAKHQFESQLAALRHQETTHGIQTNDAVKRKQLQHKLAQLETIKARQLARLHHDSRRQTPMGPTQSFHSNETSEMQTIPFNSSMSTSSSTGFLTKDTSPSIPSPLSSLFSSATDASSAAYFPSNYQSQQQQQILPSTQRINSQSLDSNYFDSLSDGKNSIFDELLTPPPSSSSSAIPHTPINNPSTYSVPSFMDISFSGTNDDGLGSPSFHNNYHRPYSSTFPY